MEPKGPQSLLGHHRDIRARPKHASATALSLGNGGRGMPGRLKTREFPQIPLACCWAQEAERKAGPCHPHLPIQRVAALATGELTLPVGFYFSSIAICLCERELMGKGPLTLFTLCETLVHVLPSFSLPSIAFSQLLLHL